MTAIAKPLSFARSRARVVFEAYSLPSLGLLNRSNMLALSLSLACLASGCSDARSSLA